MINGVYYSAYASRTGHVWMGQHDDDTGAFVFFMDDTLTTQEQDGMILYTFSDGVVLVQHDGVLETQWEWKGEPQPPELPSESYL